jgi:hypothetical protein
MIGQCFPDHQVTQSWHPSRALSVHLLGDAIALYRTIGMPKHVEIAEPMLKDAR